MTTQHRKKMILPWAGLACLLGGIGLQVATDSASSATPKRWDTAPNGNGGSPCELPLEDVVVPQRIVKGDSRSLDIYLSNNDDTEDCEVLVVINAPKFQISPREVEKRVSLPANTKQHTSWIVSPKETGNHEITIDAGYFDHASVVISVRTVIGLSAGQAQIVSYLTYFLGPILTLPWWLSLLQKSRAKKDSERQEKRKVIVPASYEKKNKPPRRWWRFWTRR